MNSDHSKVTCPRCGTSVEVDAKGHVCSPAMIYDQAVTIETSDTLKQKSEEIKQLEERLAENVLKSPEP
jgi:hypothetical protein